MDLTVCVTGAGGFIGSAVVAALHAEGARIRALTGPPGVPPASLPDGVDLLHCDILDAESLRMPFKGADVIVHAAGLPSVRESFGLSAKYMSTHAVGTATVDEVMRAVGTRRIVYVSSAEVYGHSTLSRVAEDGPVEALSPYAAAKLGAEYVLQASARSFGTCGYILRPFSVYGPGQGRATVLGTILDQASRGNLVILEDLKPVRDYCYVGDLAEAIVAACRGEAVGMTTLNVGSGVGTSVGELAAAVGAALGRKLTVCERAMRERPAEAEIYRLVADIARIERELGWQPQHALSSGIARTVRAEGLV